MAYGFLDILSTPGVRTAQAANGSLEMWERFSGHRSSDDHAALFLMDDPNRQRLKILAHMSARDLAAEPQLAERLSSPGYKGRPERAIILKLESFDWNCPQHITPRSTASEVAAGMSILRERLAEAEAELKVLRKQIARSHMPEITP
ncbi:hypothetical protein [Bradyrhizobium sp.]|uniref:hypothetical protein n=1 Tax=Bradyrhizobium sp. TaxID=376 RepID=UPI003C500477